jgi:hypothetical protein
MSQLFLEILLDLFIRFMSSLVCAQKTMALSKIAVFVCKDKILFLWVLICLNCSYLSLLHDAHKCLFFMAVQMTMCEILTCSRCVCMHPMCLRKHPMYTAPLFFFLCKSAHEISVSTCIRIFSCIKAALKKEHTASCVLSLYIHMFI